MRAHSYLAAMAMLAMRAISLGGKFALVVAISHWMPIEAVGTYGLMLGATIIFSIVGGLGLGLNASRDLVAASPDERLLMLSRLGLSFLSVYAIVIVAAVITAAMDFLSVALAVLGAVILIAEHLSAELTRILITLKRPMIGNVLLFVRNGLWVLAVFGVLWAVPELRDIETILCAWAAGAVIAAAIGTYACNEYAANWRRIRLENHFRWLISHIMKSRNIFIAMSIYVFLQYSDRFIIDQILGREAAGAFALCWSLANAVMIITSTLIIQTNYPKLIGINRASGKLALASRQLMAKSNICAVACALALGAAFIVGSKYIKPLNDNNIAILFGVLLVCSVIRVNSETLFYISYSQKKDKLLGLTMTIASIFIVLSSIIFLYAFGMQGIIISQLISAMIAFVALLWIAIPILNDRRLSSAC